MRTDGAQDEQTRSTDNDVDSLGDRGLEPDPESLGSPTDPGAAEANADVDADASSVPYLDRNDAAPRALYHRRRNGERDTGSRGIEILLQAEGQSLVGHQGRRKERPRVG